MVRINENFLRLQDSYLFSKINSKVREYIKNNPEAKIIKMGIGDVTRPIPQVIINAIKKATDEMGKSETFKGYGPEQGYDFLKEKIVWKSKNRPWIGKKLKGQVRYTIVSGRIVYERI